MFYNFYHDRCIRCVITDELAATEFLTIIERKNDLIIILFLHKDAVEIADSSNMQDVCQI